MNGSKSGTAQDQNTPGVKGERVGASHSQDDSGLGESRPHWSAADSEPKLDLVYC